MDIPDSLMAEFKETFSMFDKDGDGTVDSSELGSVMAILGQAMTDEEIQVVIAEIDVDKNGTIEFTEFVTLMQKQMKDHDEGKEIRDVFEALDKDGDGYITLDELLQTLQSLHFPGENLTKADAQEMITVFDTDKDNKLSFFEFEAIMKRK